jgi:hypothetical protein
VTKTHFADVYSSGDDSDGQTSQPITEMHLRGTSGVSTKCKACMPALSYVGPGAVIQWIWFQTWTRVIIGVPV